MRLRAGLIEIRKIRAEDCQQVLGLLRLFPGSRLGRAGGAGCGRIFQGLMQGGAQEAFVATLHQRVIGFISLYYLNVLHHGGLVASVQELVVTEELRGRGIGRALLDFARSRARELSCAGLELAGVLPGQAGSLRGGGRLAGYSGMS
ncbi:MAG: GNAT family N-acetyltransferase [Bacteroidota bacterium]